MRLSLLASGRNRLPILPTLKEWEVATVPDAIGDERLGSIESSWRVQAKRRGWLLRKLPNSGGRKFARVPEGTPRVVRPADAVAMIGQAGGEAMAALAEKQRGTYRPEFTQTTGDAYADALIHLEKAQKLGDLDAVARYQADADRLEAEGNAEEAEYWRLVGLVQAHGVAKVSPSIDGVRAQLAELEAATRAAVTDDDENGPDWSDLDVAADSDSAADGLDEIPV